MKILHLLSQRPDSTGSGIYIQSVMRQAQEHGHSNALVSGIPCDYDLPGSLRQLCTPEIHALRFEQDLAFPIVGMSDVMPYVSARFCDLSPHDVQAYEERFGRILTQAVSGFAPDIIHSNHLWLVTSLARRMFPDIPMVASCHGSDLRQFANCAHLRKRVLSGCRRLSLVLSLSREQKENIISLYGLKDHQVRVTGAGFNDQLFFAPQSRPDPWPIHIVYAGKLSRAKGVPWLLKACDRLRDQGFMLHVAGSGSGEEESSIQKTAHNMGGIIRMHGAMPQPELVKLLQKSHIFVLPSFYEGLPLVLFEALASGCALVATDLPGVREVFSSLPDTALHMVPLPAMESIDTPMPDQDCVFVDSLSTALARQINNVRSGHDPLSSSRTRDLLQRYTWTGVFERIQAAYCEAVALENSCAAWDHR